MVSRLKDPDQFQGARYELFAAATCCRAGFDIRYDDETDVTKKHPEFHAAHRQTGQEISVEAKSRHRPGVLGFQEQETGRETALGVERLLNNAISKSPDGPFVIFLDVNLPPSPEPLLQKPWIPELMSTIRRFYDFGGKAPFNLVIVTNLPHHYGGEYDLDPEKSILAVVPPLAEYPMSNPEIAEILVRATSQYGNLPNTLSDR
jgi:hypothetical protein